VDLLEIKTEPELMYLHLLFALHDQKLGVMHAHTTHTMYYAFKMLEWRRRCFAQDLENGTISPICDIRCDMRACLERKLRRNPDRAKVLDVSFCIGTTGVAERIWPDLQVALAIDTGPAFSMYGDELRKTFLKGITLYSPYYSMTEGLVGVNLWPKNLPTRYLINPNAMFFEFIPYAQMYEDNPETKIMTEVCCGPVYI
jgi:hypothetical protein